jgi:hypothetical protein
MILKGWKDIAKYLGCGVRTIGFFLDHARK